MTATHLSWLPAPFVGFHPFPALSSFCCRYYVLLCERTGGKRQKKSRKHNGKDRRRRLKLRNVVQTKEKIDRDTTTGLKATKKKGGGVRKNMDNEGYTMRFPLRC